MPKRTKILALSAVLLATLTLIVLLNYDSEPRYNGKALHQWIDLLPGSEAERAIKHIDTNAVPFLLQWLSREWQPPNSKEWLTGLLPKLPFLRKIPQIQTWLHRRDPLELRADKAAAAFKVLGPSASLALPALIRIATSTPDPGPAHRAVDALVNIGPTAIPALLAIITNKSATIRFYAVISMQQLDSRAAPAIPTLILCLKDQAVSAATYETLGRLKLEPQLVVPVLVDTAQGSDPLPRVLAILTLGDFGQKARPAVPTLLAALSDKDADVRNSATNALRQIAPEILTEN